MATTKTEAEFTSKRKENTAWQVVNRPVRRTREKLKPVPS